MAAAPFRCRIGLHRWSAGAKVAGSWNLYRRDCARCGRHQLGRPQYDFTAGGASIRWES